MRFWVCRPNVAMDCTKIHMVHFTFSRQLIIAWAIQFCFMTKDYMLDSVRDEESKPCEFCYNLIPVGKPSNPCRPIL